MNIRALLTIPAITLGSLAVWTGGASAHNATASGTCQGGVQWSATNYQKELTNSITVTIDGQVRHHDGDMKASDAGTIATDKTVGHAWSVVVNAPGSQYDKSFNGSYAACETAPTTTTVAPTTTTVAPTTTVVTTTTASPTTSVPDVATTVVTDPTTTTVVAVGIPPVPSTVALAPPVSIAAGVAEEPVLPRTGLDGVLAGLAVLFVIVGVVLVVRGRRVR